MKRTIITLLCLCLITGLTFYLLRKSGAQNRNHQPKTEKQLTEDSQTISVPGKSAGTQNPASELAQPDAKTEQERKPFSRFYGNIKPSPEKTIKLPVLLESEKRQATDEKRLRIGAVREFGKPVAEISDGSLFPIAEGSVWLVKIESGEALQLRLHFTNVNLPKGAKIFVYSSENPDDVFVFEKTLDAENRDFWTPSLSGDAVVVEYFTPDRDEAQKGVLPFEIARVGHIYMNPSAFGENNFSPPEEPCHLNVPSSLTELAKSVGHLRFVDGGGVYVCTGTLLNNESEDLDPLLLTANHCISTQASAQSLEVFWNYNSGDFPSSQAIRSGESILLGTGSASDFTLLRVLGAVPTRTNQVFWSGWSTNAPPIGTNIFTIHHPSGSYKRYSSGSTINFCISGLPCQNTIGVRYSQGTTEGGSSGGGLWNLNEKQFVGTLTGGESGCGIRDAFGKFSATYTSISSFMQGSGDDNFDAGGGNDDAAAASTISSGTHNNLIVKWLDEDWYRISLPNNGTLSVTVNFNHSYGDMDLNLFRGSETNPAAVSASGSNAEAVTYTNSSGATQNLFLRVFLFDGARNTYSMNISAPPAGPSDAGKMFDYDGDGKADISVFRPSNGAWFVLQSSNNALFSFGFGLSSDQIAPADFDGDGRTDMAVFRPSSGTWFLQQSKNGFAALQFGQAGDVPVPADFDGDRRADIAVFRPSNGVWYRLNSSNNSFFAAQFGTNGDKPQIGDFDDDGKADLAVFRPSNGTWYILRSSDGAFYGAAFGQIGDIPTTADFDGDRRADIAVYRPSEGFWYRLNSSNNQFFAQKFGISEDKPVPADYDNDGRADIAVYRPSNGVWYLSLSTAGFTAVQFGASGDVPTPTAFGQ